MPDSIAVVILAAGASTRMGNEIKQLLPWKNTTLLGNAAHQASLVSDRVVAVLGAHAEAVKKTLPPRVRAVVNPDWRLGIGNSISCGAAHILHQKAALEGLLVMLADQPLLDASFLNGLKRAFIEKQPKIMATDYGKTFGVPAIFHHSILPELRKLHQDFGARQIIQKYGDGAFGLSPKGKEVDVDTKESYLRLIEKINIGTDENDGKT